MFMNKVKQLLVVVLLIISSLPFSVRAEDLYIRNIEVTSGEEGQVKISWTTNLLSVGGVLYDENQTFSNYVGTSLVDTRHEVTLVSLKSQTTYYFKVSATANNQTVQSFANTFKTDTFKYAKDLVISNIRTSYIGGTSLAVQWASDRPADSYVVIAKALDYQANGFKRSKRYGGRGLTTQHEVTATRLERGTIYYFQAQSKDKDGNQAFGTVRQFTTYSSDIGDKSDLVINKIAPASSPDPLITSTSVTWLWSTNRPALGYVDWRPEKRGPKKGRINETGWSVTEHSLTATDLVPNTTYIFKIYTRDILGKKVTTPDLYVRTSPEGMVLGASTSVASITPPPVQTGIVFYTQAHRNLPLEQAKAQELRAYLKQRFGGVVPPISRDNWFTLIRAFTYGGYPADALVQAVRFGGKTVHPAIFWSAWRNSADYKNYINR